MRVAQFAILFPALTATSCSDTQAPLTLSSDYVLSTVNGSSLPFVVDSVRSQRSFDYRIVGRSIKFLSADSVQYEQASDIVQLLPDGSRYVVESACFGMRTVYGAHRSFVVITIDSNRFQPPAPVPIRYDTLRLFGDTLIYQRIDANRVLRFAFVGGQPTSPVCGSFAAPPNTRLKLTARVDYGMSLSSARRSLSAIR